MDFMLNKMSRDDFIKEIIKLNDLEREKLFGYSKMQIFRALVEEIESRNKSDNE
jgi:hypothetical protein